MTDLCINKHYNNSKPYGNYWKTNQYISILNKCTHSPTRYLETTYPKAIIPCHFLPSGIKSLWLMCQISFFFRIRKENNSKNQNKIKPYHLETSLFLYLIRGPHSPCFTMPEKLLVSLVNVRFQAPVVFQVNKRSIMHTTCRLHAGSFADPFRAAHGALAVVTVTTP